MSKFHFIQPYSMKSPPNIGGSINQAIEQLHADGEDWIILTDHDVCWLRSDSKRQLISILETTEYDVLGPVTNRLSMPHQVIDGMFDVMSFDEHVRVGNYLHERNYGQVISTSDILAAFCLCFRVSTWRSLGCFLENSIQFDSVFSCDAINKGYKLGIMSGIYLWHSYRILSDCPKFDISHLI